MVTSELESDLLNIRTWSIEPFQVAEFKPIRAVDATFLVEEGAVAVPTEEPLTYKVKVDDTPVKTTAILYQSEVLKLLKA